MKLRKTKRLKIVEQITIVVLLSVFIPLLITGLIVNNVNQHAVRNELSYSAQMISSVIAKSINTFFDASIAELNEVSLALKYIYSDYSQSVYLKDVLINSTNFRDIKIIRPSETTFEYSNTNKIIYDDINKSLIITEKVNNDNYLVASIDLATFENAIFELVKTDNRQVYIIDNKNKELIISHNFTQDEFDTTIAELPNKMVEKEPKTFGGVKNQPIAYYKMQSPDITVIVNTTGNITDKTIYTARYKIVLAIFVAAMAILFIIGIYTYYLYINIRQLFKGLLAISKGNYKRKIRLLTNIFTPFEIIFLAQEFNKMVFEINMSYRKLKQKNRELKILDEFRSNLIDTVSHEFRTPLTSIQGYTSRLLRQDIDINEEVRIKSLKTIKTQSERLSRMVEDLLVIPDIEGSKLNIKLEDVNLNKILDSALWSLKNRDNREFIIKIDDNFPPVQADNDRLEQVLINLLENANKYAYENTPIYINVTGNGEFATIQIENQADYIDNQTLKILFDKFTRVDDLTTRTTRGTGLGLYIVKGLINAMGAKIELKSSHDNKFTATINFVLQHHHIRTM